MKTTLLTLAAILAMSGASFAAEGERPEPQDNRRPYYGQRYEQRAPRIYVEPTERLRNPRPYRPALGNICATPRFACELYRAQPLGDDCWCYSPSGARRSGVVTR